MSTPINLLEKAISIALKAHIGQRDKAGETYILHPLRLMTQAKTEDERIVAVLHDVVEDSNMSLDDLRTEGFPEHILDAIECLTKKPGEAYDDFIECIAANPLASRVKVLDMEDNSDLSRLSAPTEKDIERREKYQRAIARLKQQHDS